MKEDCQTLYIEHARKERLKETFSGVELTISESSLAENSALMSLRGFLDTFNSKFFQDHAFELVRQGYHNIAVDLRKVNFLASSGIGALVGLYKNLKENSGTLVLIGMQRQVREVMHLLGFFHYFLHAEDLDAAASRFAEEARKPPLPRIQPCPVCERNLRLEKIGRFRCPRCRTILTIDAGHGITSE